MRTLYAFILLLFIPAIINSQPCLPQGIVFTTQAQIDNFQVNYPGCDQIAGNVTISGADITNLTGLNNLTSIGGTLWINSNNALTDLSGIGNLLSIGGSLYINNDSSLVNLAGINSLLLIGGVLYVADNRSLTSLMGLGNLSVIGSDLIIRNNPLLTNLSSLINVDELNGELTIEDNESLVQLTGLNNINSVAGSVVIQRNFSLGSMTGLNSLASIGGAFVIWHNHWLATLAGLESLHTIWGQLSIQWNHYLTNLAGLDNLEVVGAQIFISHNYRLLDLTGLESLISCYQFNLSMDTALVSLNGVENLTNIAYDLTLVNNKNLTDIEALTNVSSAPQFIRLYGNLKLESLDGLDNIIDTSILRLTIESNHKLSDCAVESICNYLSNPGGLIEISDNETGCNNAAEILEACETLSADESSVVGRQSSVKVYPNPSSDQIIIELARFSSLKNTIAEIYNVNGQLVMKRKLTKTLSVIDIRDFLEGVYIVKIMDERSIFYSKFIKR